MQSDATCWARFHGPLYYDFKNVQKRMIYSTINDENKYKSLFIYFQNFRFNFVVSERNVHILFCRYFWAELYLLFWTFLSGTFFQVGGVHVHPVQPPPRLRTRLLHEAKLAE